MLFLSFFSLTSKSHLSVNGWVLLFLFYCSLDSSNKINCISSLFFEEIYILSFPIIHKFVWLVVVLTLLPVKLYAEDELLMQQKSIEVSQEYRILVRIIVSWMCQIK